MLITFSFFSVDFYLKLETSLRAFCLKLHAKAFCLNKLPDDVSFNIQLHTTELSQEEFNSNPAFEVKLCLKIHAFLF